MIVTHLYPWIDIARNVLMNTKTYYCGFDIAEGLLPSRSQFGYNCMHIREQTVELISRNLKLPNSK